MTEADGAVAKLSMELANRTTRRGLLGRFTKGMGVVMGASAGSLLFAERAEATHQNESVKCLNHPNVGYNGCPNCKGGHWFACDNRCGIKVTVWKDCCATCSGGCTTVSDSSDPEGRGYTCCFSGYCGSGCSGKKVKCRYWTCQSNPPC
jgi:hypothetical protein